MHDDYIVSYSVDIEKKSIKINTCNSEKTKMQVIHFTEVLTHSFNCVIQNNILFDVAENDLNAFINENTSELIKYKQHCWPIYYEGKDELVSYLMKNKYSYYIISSSLGMSGWVLAKSFSVEDVDKL